MNILIIVNLEFINISKLIIIFFTKNDKKIDFFLTLSKKYNIIIMLVDFM